MTSYVWSPKEFFVLQLIILLLQYYSKILIKCNIHINSETEKTSIVQLTDRTNCNYISGLVHKTAIVLPSCASPPMRQNGTTMFSWHPHGQTQTERLKHELWCYLALLRGCVSTTETKFTVPRFPPKMRSPGPWILPLHPEDNLDDLTQGRTLPQTRS